jgi:hypothetical protein
MEAVERSRQPEPRATQEAYMDIGGRATQEQLPRRSEHGEYSYQLYKSLCALCLCSRRFFPLKSLKYCSGPPLDQGRIIFVIYNPVIPAKAGIQSFYQSAYTGFRLSPE